jgi:hypothetical protein
MTPPRRVGRPRAPEESFTLYVRVGAALHRRLERIALSRPGLSLSTVARYFLTRGINITADERPAERGPASNGITSRAGAPWD